MGNCGKVLMSGYRGSYDYSIDEKGRVNIPARFRKAMNPEADETFVIIQAPDRCLRAYPLDAFKKFEEELSIRPQTRATTDLRRVIFSMARESTLDSQGRISLSPRQIEIAGIEKEVTLVGEGGFIEIWDTRRHAEYLAKIDFDEVFYQSVEGTMNQKPEQ